MKAMAKLLFLDHRISLNTRRDICVETLVEIETEAEQLSPADPSSNDNIARKAYFHCGALTWLNQCATFRQCEVTAKFLVMCPWLPFVFADGERSLQGAHCLHVFLLTDTRPRLL